MAMQPVNNDHVSTPVKQMEDVVDEDAGVGTNKGAGGYKHEDESDGEGEGDGAILKSYARKTCPNKQVSPGGKVIFIFDLLTADIAKSGSLSSRLTMTS